jgi:acyl carrier protein
MVEDWVALLRPNFRPALGHSFGHSSPLRPTETRAIALSHKVADLVSRGQDSVREALESRDFDIAAVGIDSIGIIDLISFIKRTFQIIIGFDQILDSQTTIRSLAALIDASESRSG